MAEVIAKLATQRAATPSVKNQVRKNHGRLRVMFDEFDFSGELTSGDTIRTMLLPGSSKIYEAMLRSSAGLTGGNDWDFGHDANDDLAADPDAFIDAADLSAAAAIVKMTDQPGNAGHGLELGADELQTRILTNATTTGADTKTIQVWVFYALD